MGPSRDLRVFVNCPCDDKYLPIFHAILFAIHDLGFQARHAPIDNTAVLRVRRIYEVLEGSLYSILELGQVALSPKSKLPRFNMPFEAGIAYSMHEAGGSGRKAHHMLLLDKAPHRIQISMSDGAGIDGRAHRGSPALAIEAIVKSLVQSAKLNGRGPWAYLRNLLARLRTQLNSRIEEFLPHRWQP